MKFSIVTPVYNGEKYIAETIESVLSQKGDFEIEYIIMDGGSDDKTVEIIKKYEEKLKNGCWETKCKNISFGWFSERDKGMYDAINKGFAKATGDVYAWINSDDIYLPGAFAAISKTLAKYPEIEWIKGITSFINEDSTIHEVGLCYLYNQRWIIKGIYGRSVYVIPQDSVFWKSELWKKVGEINNTLKLAGDYYLWTYFAEHTPLYSLKAYVSCFRIQDYQLSKNIEQYKEEQRVSSPLITTEEKIARLFFKKTKKMPLFFYPLLYVVYNLIFRKQSLEVIEIKRKKLENNHMGAYNNPVKRKSKSFMVR